MNPQEIVKKMVLEGSTQANIGKVLGWNQSTVSRHIKTLNISIDEVQTGEEWKLNCPNCNDDYVHISQAKNRRGWEGIEDIDGEGSSQTPEGKEEHQGYRQGGFTFNMWCERCDKNMNINFNEHKGNTFITVTNIKDNVV